MALDEAGIPSVAVHTHVFERLSKSVALANGMPTMRQAFVPQPVVDRSPSDLRTYIEGKDPVSSRPFMQEILEGLTNPLNDKDLSGVSFERNTPKFLEPDTEENLKNLFEEKHWTDFLPISLPTEGRVQEMLKGTSHSADEVVGKLRPTGFREFWEFTVEKVAVNAVMAGAKPEYFPVILAMAASGETARSSSTTSFSGIAVVNGPIRNEIGMNCGIGALGPFNRANSTIGRSWNLLSQNLQGGSVPGETYMGTLGNFVSCAPAIAENEEDSPWAPLHTQFGFGRDESTVTVFRGGRYMQSGFGPREEWQTKLKRVFAASEARESPLLVMDPIVANGFVEKGFDSKEKLVDWCADNALLPAHQYWNEQWVQTLIRPRAVAGIEPYASYLNAEPDDMLKMYTADEINIVVTGGQTQGAWKVIEARRRENCTLSVDQWR